MCLELQIRTSFWILVLFLGCQDGSVHLYFGPSPRISGKHEWVPPAKRFWMTSSDRAIARNVDGGFFSGTSGESTVLCVHLFSPSPSSSLTRMQNDRLDEVNFLFVSSCACLFFKHREDRKHATTIIKAHSPSFMLLSADPSEGIEWSFLFFVRCA